MQDARRMPYSTQRLLQHDVLEELTISASKLSLFTDLDRRPGCPPFNSSQIRTSDLPFSLTLPHEHVDEIGFLKPKASRSRSSKTTSRYITENDIQLDHLLTQRRWSTSSDSLASAFPWRDSESSTLCGTSRASTTVGLTNVSSPRKSKRYLDNIRIDIHKILECLDIAITRLSLYQSTAHQRSRGSGAPQDAYESTDYSSPSTARTPAHLFVPPPLNGSKRQYSEDADHPDSDEEDIKRRKSDKGNNPDVSARGPPLACPFFKHNETKHQECRRYKLFTLAALKQHLGRVHDIGPHFCDHCYQRFDSKASKRDHSAQGCERTLQPSWEFRVHQQINGRKQRGQSVEDAWSELYKNMFPEAPAPCSPHVGDDAQKLVLEIMTCLRKNDVRLSWLDLDMSGMRRKTRELVRKAAEELTNEPQGEYADTAPAFDASQVHVPQIPMDRDSELSHVDATVPTFHEHYLDQRLRDFEDVSGGSFAASSNRNQHINVNNRRSAPTLTASARIPVEARPWSYPARPGQVSQNNNIEPRFTPTDLGMNQAAAITGQNIGIVYPFGMNPHNGFVPTQIPVYGRQRGPQQYSGNLPPHYYPGQSFWRPQNEH